MALQLYQSLLTYSATVRLMSQRKGINSDLREFLLLHPSKRRQERLVSLLSKNRDPGRSHPNPSLIKENHEYNMRHEQQVMKLIEKGEQKEKTQSQFEMGHTNFMNKYMQRLKKQRKRQERRKSNFNFTKKETVPKKDQNTMYIFLPIVSKGSQPQIENKNMLTTITTIDLIGEKKLNKMKKSRTFSLDDKLTKMRNSQEEHSYELKVQEVIQDIKNNRHKLHKIESMSIGESSIPQRPQLQQNLNQPQFAVTQRKIEEKSELIKPKKGGWSRLVTLTAKKLQPWTTQSDQLQHHLIPDYAGIESFDFS